MLSVGRWASLSGNASHLNLLANSRFAACRNNGIDQLLQNHANGPNRIIVSRNWIIDHFGIGVGIDNSDNWNPEPPRLIHGILLADRLDLTHRIGQMRNL